jgi:WD40 repeat protein
VQAMKKIPVSYEYQIGGSLPADASSYVMRQADLDFYECLKANEFCYVLNSRQMGKSSLRVRTMQKLQAEGFLCAFIDLTGIGKEDVTAEKWYAGLVQSLVSSYQLGKKFQWRTWWKEQREFLSPVQRLSLFIEEVLLVEIEQNIVIFVDEIDSVLSLNFSLDDFFALIRFFYNRRVDEPKYQRITFALLGVATPSDLIADKTQTPFNIGRAIALNGFQLHEVQPLTDGLTPKVSNPQFAIAQILDWTGGQPFLTQKLCKLIIEASALGNSPSVEQVVKSRIIENWESQDEPEHLKTIRDRILRNQQKAGQLLGLYQQILESANPPQPPLASGGLNASVQPSQPPQPPLASGGLNAAAASLSKGEIAPLSPPLSKGEILALAPPLNKGELGGVLADGSPEQTELRLSGLVVQQQGKLKVYNRIYEQIFNQKWVEKQLEKLRPYFEAFNAWVASNYQDESRLLRGKALQDALSWSTNQSLSPLDYRFLAASQDFDKREVQQALAVKEEEGQILAKANQTLTVAQQQVKTELTQAKRSAKRIVSIGSAILIISLIAAAVIQLKVWQAERELLAQQVEFESFSSQKSLISNPFEALLSALKAAGRLKKLEKSGSTDDRMRMQVVNALQQAVYSVRERDRIIGHQGNIGSVVFSPDGKTLASASDDNTVKLWNVEKHTLQKTLVGHQDGVRSLSFSPDSKILASASNDGTVKLWNFFNGTVLKTIKAHNDVVASVSFSPDGKILASASKDGTVKLWDVNRATELKTLRGYRDWVLSVTFSPDGKTLAFSSGDRTVKLWNVEDNTVRTLKAHRHWVRNVRFSPDGKVLASSSEDGTVKLWNVKDGKLQKTLEGHNARVSGLSFSPDGKTLASSGEDNTIKLWHVENLEGVLLETLRGPSARVAEVSFSPDGKTLASAGSDNTVRLWNLEDVRLQTLASHQDAIGTIRFSPDGKILASASLDDTVKLWNVQNGSLLKTFKNNGQEYIDAVGGGNWFEGKTFKGNGEEKQEVLSASFSQDGKILAVAIADGTVTLWSAENGSLLKILKGHSKGVLGISFSPDGKILASASADSSVKLWDIENGIELKTLRGHGKEVWSVGFSPDGNILASASADGTVKLWNVHNGTEELKPLWKQSGEVTGVSFSPDGKTLAISSRSGTVNLWNVNNGTLLKTWEADGIAVTGVSFSPDGKTLASAGSEGTVKLWDVEKGTQIQTLEGHLGQVTSISFSPDGKTLASAGIDKTVKLSNLERDLDNLIRRGCLWLEDYLASHPEEARKFSQICK